MSRYLDIAGGMVGTIVGIVLGGIIGLSLPVEVNAKVRTDARAKTVNSSKTEEQEHSVLTETPVIWESRGYKCPQDLNSAPVWFGVECWQRLSPEQYADMKKKKQP